MSNIKAIKTVMLLENLQGLFRRDVFNSKYMKYIVPSIWPLVILVLIFQDFNLNLSGICMEIQNVIQTLKSFSIIICSTYNSDKFIKMIKLINNFHVLIEREKAYLNMTKYLNVVVTLTVLFFLVLGITVQIIGILYPLVNTADLLIMCNPKEVVMLLFIGLFLADCFALTGALLYYCLCSVIAYQLESLSELIRTDMDSLQSNITDKFILPKQYWRRWGDNYVNISDCVLLLNSVFGLQITLMITGTGIYFIYLFQIIVAANGYLNIFMVILVQFMAIAFISKAGQVIKNKAIDLKRTLVRENLKILQGLNEESFNAISSVISLTSDRPIRTEIFGHIATGYAMLPAVFMYYTTPLIIVLQFKVQ